MNDEPQVNKPPGFAFKLNWKITLFTLLLLPLLVSLGFWQLHRAQEKQTIQEEYQQQQALPPVDFDRAGMDEGNFRRVRVTGKFVVDRYWLLENKIQNGRLGYHVIMPFDIDDRAQEDKQIVVNRGWVEAKTYRDDLPDFSTPQDRVALTGMLVMPSSSPFIDESQSQLNGWPHRLLELDLDVMQQQSGRTLFSKVLQLDADSPGALMVNWQPINMTPEKHRAYAVQWFVLALALVILFLFANSNIVQILTRNRK